MNGARGNGARRNESRLDGTRRDDAPEPEPAELTAAGRPPIAVIEAALGDDYAVAPGELHVEERVLLDTFDGRLRAAEIALRWQDGELALLDLSDVGERQVASAAAPAPAAPLAARGLPEGELRRALAPVIEPRALLPLAHLSVTTQTLAILDPLDKTVARLHAESPVLVPARGRSLELSTRIRFAAVRGYDEDLSVVRRRLGRALGLQAAEETLFEEAVSAAGGRPDGLCARVRVRLAPDEPADAAAVRVLRRLMEISDANLPGALADTDSEFLHDLRVSIRRTRAVQRELQGVFPEAELERIRGEFRWLQRATGRARDLDVHVLDFEAMRALVPERLRGDLEPLLVVLRRRRMVAHGVMARDLRSDRAGTLWDEWADLLGRLAELPRDGRPAAVRPIGELAGTRIWHVYRRMVRQGRALEPDSPPQDFHELRKQGKELRYLLELFGAPLHDRSAVKPMVRTLKRLQDLLGHHQDREVQIAMLRDAADEVAALPGGSRALMAMGVLIERLADDAAVSRQAFADCFAEFASGSQRKLARKAFA